MRRGIQGALAASTLAGASLFGCGGGGGGPTQIASPEVGGNQGGVEDGDREMSPSSSLPADLAGGSDGGSVEGPGTTGTMQVPLEIIGFGTGVDSWISGAEPGTVVSSCVDLIEVETVKTVHDDRPADCEVADVTADEFEIVIPRHIVFAQAIDPDSPMSAPKYDAYAIEIYERSNWDQIDFGSEGWIVYDDGEPTAVAEVGGVAPQQIWPIETFDSREVPEL